jgi:NAD(P)-dependent dehydrogenase (short-subunit alcohol dehydrogenase family)
LDHPRWGKAIRAFPIPMGEPAQPEQIANVIAFLLSPEAAFCCGSVFFVDGGSDAVMRPDGF